MTVLPYKSATKAVRSRRPGLPDLTCARGSSADLPKRRGLCIATCPTSMLGGKGWNEQADILEMPGPATGVHLFNRYEYLLFTVRTVLYWESPGFSGCFRQCLQ
jgi:hypothetical protein